MKNDVNDARDRLLWKWKSGTLDAAQVGTPQAQTDLAVCFYDQGGLLLGGRFPKGTTWRAVSNGLRYEGPAGTEAGVTKGRLRTGTGSKSLITVKGTENLPVLPLTVPLRAQLVNLDDGACWETVFPVVTKNDGTKVIARIP
jgi:hypothetical protein